MKLKRKSILKQLSLSFYTSWWTLITTPDVGVSASFLQWGGIEALRALGPQGCQPCTLQGRSIPMGPRELHPCLPQPRLGGSGSGGGQSIHQRPPCACNPYS